MYPFGQSKNIWQRKGSHDRKRNQFTASDIIFDNITNYRIYPVYHLVNGIKNKNLSKIINEVLNTRFNLEDYIPDYYVDKYNFINKIDAVKEMHQPSSINNLKRAKLRTIYEEFFIFMFKMNYLKYKYMLDNKGIERIVDKNKVDEYKEEMKKWENIFHENVRR